MEIEFRQVRPNLEQEYLDLVNCKTNNVDAGAEPYGYFFYQIQNEFRKLEDNKKL